jgi:hypothetical protein
MGSAPLGAEGGLLHAHECCAGLDVVLIRKGAWVFLLCSAFEGYRIVRVSGSYPTDWMLELWTGSISIT